MTLDERAARAADGLRRAVVQAGARNDALRLSPAQWPRRPRILMAATAVITAVVVLATFALAHSISGRQQRRTAGLPAPGGVLLYGQWHPNLQESSWFTIQPNNPVATDLHLTSTCASWFPGGRKILISDDAYARTGHLLRPATLRPDGTGLHRLDATHAPQLNLGCGQVSPDGHSIALEGFGAKSTASTNGIYLVRASDGGGLVQLTHSPTDSSDGDPRFAPDGRNILFLRSAPDSSIEGAGTLYITTTTGASPRRITPRGFAFLGYDWSPDGRWIVLQHPYGQIYLVHPDGTALHRLPLQLPTGAGAQDPTWAPDSRTIAFSLTDNGEANIFTVQLDGSHLHQLTHNVGLSEQTPDWSR